MRSSPKIYVLKAREIVYTLLLLFLAILLVVCLVLMFSRKNKNPVLPGTGIPQTVSENMQSDAAIPPVSDQTPDSTDSKYRISESGQSDSASEHTGQSSTSSESQSSSAETVSEASVSVSYTPGIYTTPITLGDSVIDVEVTVDSSRIQAIRLVNLSESTAASFPLVSPSLDHIASQILEKQSLEGITCPQENRYTSQILLSAVADALRLASAVH